MNTGYYNTKTGRLSKSPDRYLTKLLVLDSRMMALKKGMKDEGIGIEENVG